MNNDSLQLRNFFTLSPRSVLFMNDNRNEWPQKTVKTEKYP